MEDERGDARVVEWEHHLGEVGWGGVAGGGVSAGGVGGAGERELDGREWDVVVILLVPRDLAGEGFFGRRLLTLLLVSTDLGLAGVLSIASTRGDPKWVKWEGSA